MKDTLRATRHPDCRTVPANIAFLPAPNECTYTCATAAFLCTRSRISGSGQHHYLTVAVYEERSAQPARAVRQARRGQSAHPERSGSEFHNQCRSARTENVKSENESVGLSSNASLRARPLHESPAEAAPLEAWHGRRCGHCGSMETVEVNNRKPMPYSCPDCRSCCSIRTGTSLAVSGLLSGSRA